MAGGFPLELPALSRLRKSFVKPSTMLYRNMLAMDDGGTVALSSRRRRRIDGRL